MRVLFIFFEVWNTNVQQIRHVKLHHVKLIHLKMSIRHKPFFQPKMLQNAPEKKMPSTHANATKRVTKLLNCYHFS